MTNNYNDSSQTPAEWPFDQPPNCAVITLKRIIWENQPIRYVSHDEDDHGWQFLDGNDIVEEDGAIVCLEEIVELDPAVLEIAHIPPGYFAWREEPDAPWNIEKHEEELDEDNDE